MKFLWTLNRRFLKPQISEIIQLLCRRKQREAKRSSKAVQAERLKEKAQTKKSSITMVNKLRKQRQRSGFQGELDMDAELEAMNKSKNSGAQRLSKCE